MSNAQIAEYLLNFKEPEIVIRKSDPTEEGLAKTLEECVAANPQRFTDDLRLFQEVKNFYQHRMLHGFLGAWRDKKEFDWTALLIFICQILLSEQFWAEQHDTYSNYRQWTLLVIADLITSGTENDKHAFDVQLLPFVEQILLVLVEVVEPSPSTLENLPNVPPNSDRGKVFSAMVNYALRFACTNDTTQGDCRWPQTIKENFTKRLDRSVEPSLEFSYTLGFYLPCLSYLDKEWVIGNIDRIFPQQNEDHWQAAFTGYLYYPDYPYADLYARLKEHGHYSKALNTNFTDREAHDRLVSHLCVGWIINWETLNDDASLIYQLIHSGNPNLLFSVVDFFLMESESLCQSDDPEKMEAYEKVKAKVKPAWCALYQVLSRNSDVGAYQKVLGPLSGWLGLIDTIDVEVLSWVKESIKYIDKPDGYGVTLSRFFKALLKHTSETPGVVGEIYLEIPQRVIWDLQAEKNDIIETIRILYNDGQEETANKICHYFVESGSEFLRPLYKKFRC